MTNLQRDVLLKDAADVEFADVMLANGLEHPVHQAVVMAWNSHFGPVFELVQQNGSEIGPSFCKYAVVVDPSEAAGFPKDMALRMPIGFKVNISMKYGPVYDPDEITFPLSTNGRMPRYLKILHQLVKRDHLLIGSLAWADQPLEAWADFEEGLRTGRIFSAHIIEVAYKSRIDEKTGRKIKDKESGLKVQCGLLGGFIPAGLVDFRKKFCGMTIGQKLHSMVGQRIKVKVLATKVNDKKTGEERQSLILSEVAAMDGVRRVQKPDYLRTLREGDQLSGFVTNVQPFGIFVRVGDCCDGLVRPENLIGETPELHQPVTVEVINVNRERGHLNLRLDHMFELEALDGETLFDLGILDEVEPDLSALDS